MRIKIDIPDYDGEGLDVIWDAGSRYAIRVDGDCVSITANKEGFISLAKQMLYMAHNDLPMGSHIHLDSFFTKMDNQEYELVIGKEQEDHYPAP